MTERGDVEICLLALARTATSGERRQVLRHAIALDIDSALVVCEHPACGVAHRPMRLTSMVRHVTAAELTREDDRLGVAPRAHEPGDLRLATGMEYALLTVSDRDREGASV